MQLLIAFEWLRESKLVGRSSTGADLAWLGRDHSHQRLGEELIRPHSVIRITGGLDRPLTGS
jgi:hypothetical protein